MPKFVLQQINLHDNTKSPVYYLYRDERCLVDDFVEMCKANQEYEPLLGDLYAIIRRAANGEALPKKLYKKVKGQPNAWEARKGDVRLYTYRQGEGPIIILGGDKNTQDKDLGQLAAIIQEYKNTPLKDVIKR